MKPALIFCQPGIGALLFQLAALAVAGRLEWLLWLAGTVAHLFWMSAWVLQYPNRRRDVERRRGKEAE